MRIPQSSGSIYAFCIDRNNLGKTSAMRWLAKQLELWNDKGKPRDHNHPKVYPVWFDSWKYRTREDVWRGLIAEIILHCISVSEPDQENVMLRMTQAAKQMGRRRRPDRVRWTSAWRGHP